MIFKSLKNSPLFFGGLSTALMLSLTPAAQAQAQPAQDFFIVSGNASYLQRIAMPPEAVLTVQVQDVSRADASATVLAESREVFGRRQVPVAYSVKVARSAIDPRMRYTVRATISVAGQTQFATTRQYPVLTHGAPSQHDLLLAAVPEVGRPAPPA
ncbi:MAG: YbaY family lipoprotein [Polaromonas sp.]